MTTTGQSHRGEQSTALPLMRLVLLLIFSILVCISVLVWKKQDVHAATCRANLVAIHRALQQHEADGGHLPEMALFPDDANDSIDSLLHVLRPYGIREATCICPALPESLRGFGITYLWNAAHNNKRLADLPSDAWLLVEVNALRPQIPKPHRFGFQILYADGQVVATDRPPRGL